MKTLEIGLSSEHLSERFANVYELLLVLGIGIPPIRRRYSLH